MKNFINLIKRLFKTINSMMTLNKIIDEMEKDYKKLEADYIAIRYRANEAEKLNEYLIIKLRDARLANPRKSA